MSSSKKTRKGGKNTPLTTIIVAVVLIVVALISHFDGDSDTDSTEKSSVSTDGSVLTVHFLDVGQGDSEFIELPNGECMLIDASISDYGGEIVDTIESLGYSEIDYLVATHPHADHIGGMTEVVESLDIGSVYMPKAVTDTKTYENLLTAISDKGLKINTAGAGTVIYSDSGLSIDILAPVSDEYDDLNNYSAVVKITYGKNSFLFTGDAENEAEDEMIENSYSALDCDVLKVGHHGSSTSSGTEFLDAVTPEYAVISCGEGNSYGHPHEETLTKLANIGAEVYRTDKEGDVTISCDGSGDYEVECEK